MTRLEGLAADLFAEIGKMKVIDTHEHLYREADRVSREVDVTTLFSHYLKPDLEAAGLLHGAPQNEVYDTSKPLAERWQKLKPYFEAVRYGAHAYPAIAYVREILGFPDIDDATVESISARLKQDNKPGLYKALIQDLCNIELCIQCVGGVIEGGQPFFRYLWMDITDGISAQSIQSLESVMDCSIHTMQDYVKSLGAYAEMQKEKGAVGMKIASAYNRDLDFQDVPAGRAEEVFVQLRGRVRPQISAGDQKLLEDYLLRREVEACVDVGTPIAIHTGYQYGNKNDIRNTRAVQLWSLLKSYPKARFDLYHGSIPYVSDMTVLGKYFENVALNMCYMHLLSPCIAQRALHEWIDAVPVTKIFAFGGDYGIVEKIYGHLKLARADVATVLADEVERGRFTAEEALHVAHLLFYENPKRWYGL